MPNLEKSPSKPLNTRESLVALRAEYEAGIARIASQIESLQTSRIATDGAVQVLEKIIASLPEEVKLAPAAK